MKRRKKSQASHERNSDYDIAAVHRTPENGFVKVDVDFKKDLAEVARTAQSHLDLHSNASREVNQRKYALPSVQSRGGKTQLGAPSTGAKEFTYLQNGAMSQRKPSGRSVRQLPPL